MKKKVDIIKLTYFGAIAVLLFTFCILILEKSQISNLYTKPQNKEVSTPRPVNDVQYSPADPTDNDEINQKKQDGTIGQDSIPATTGSPINVVLTAAGQDIPGGPIVIRVLLTDTTNGTCDVILTKSGTTKKYSSSVINAGTYYTCEGFDVPLEDIEVGNWDLAVTVTSADRIGTTKQTVEVK